MTADVKSCEATWSKVPSLIIHQDIFLTCFHYYSRPSAGSLRVPSTVHVLALHILRPGASTCTFARIIGSYSGNVWALNTCIVRQCICPHHNTCMYRHCMCAQHVYVPAVYVRSTRACGGSVCALDTCMCRQCMCAQHGCARAHVVMPSRP